MNIQNLSQFPKAQLHIFIILVLFDEQHKTQRYSLRHDKEKKQQNTTFDEPLILHPFSNTT